MEVTIHVLDTLVQMGSVIGQEALLASSVASVW
jgi:hypothetical protein